MNAIGCESIIFPALIYHANQPFGFRILIRNEAIQLSHLKRSLIALVIET